MNAPAAIDPSPLIDVIVPFRNEAQGLPSFLQSLRKNLETIGNPYEVICVDDGSDDSGWQILKEEIKISGYIKGIRLTRHFGKENAIRAGLRAVSAKAAIIMDADMQHPPELIPEMVQIWQNKDMPVIKAVKTSPSRGNLIARLLLWVYGLLLRKAAKIEVYNQTDYILIDRKIIDRINHLPERITFFRGIVEWFGYASYQINFDVPERTSGRSSWSFLNAVNFAVDGITVFTSAPLRLVTVCGIIFSILSLVLIGQTLYMKWSGQALEGFTTVIICILIVGSVLTMGLGIIGEYIARIYKEVKQRPLYIIKETANLEIEDYRMDEFME